MKYTSKIMVVAFSILSISMAAVSAQATPSISSNTTLNISIKGVPNTDQGRIDGQYVVGDSGYVFLPLLKERIKASGLSSSALSRRIEEAYKNSQIYKDPRITVISTKDTAAQGLDAQVIHVGGFVGSRGPKPYIRNMTLFEAITAAGGAGTFGSLKRVELYRGGKKFVYNLNKRENMMIKVFPKDNIVVPQKTIFGN